MKKTTTSNDNGTNIANFFVCLSRILIGKNETGCGTKWNFYFFRLVNCREFGDYYKKAIDETWYRSAVLQHKVDNESFIYAVPHDDKDDVKEPGDIKVMASHAIFRMDAGKEAPGCVVGFQFDQKHMYQRFKEITSKSYDASARKKKIPESLIPAGTMY